MILRAVVSCVSCSAITVVQEEEVANLYLELRLTKSNLLQVSIGDHRLAFCHKTPASTISPDFSLYFLNQSVVQREKICLFFKELVNKAYKYLSNELIVAALIPYPLDSLRISLPDTLGVIGHLVDPHLLQCLLRKLHIFF